MAYVHPEPAPIHPPTLPASHLTAQPHIHADATNWRTRAEYFIGEEEVEYKGFRVEEGKFPIVAITAKDKETLDRVFDKVIAYSDSLEPAA